MIDERYMRRALELAARGAGTAAPNPMVGAVLVHNDRIIGEGWHRQYGQAHAEVNCLEAVLPADRDLIPESTMYVSLEPCAHWGKTPPCANRLVAEKVREVVIANIDPFAQVSGNGIRILQEAGIKVTSGILEEEGAWLNRRFFTVQQQRRPYIILKWAQSVEGYIGPADGSRLQLSNAFSTRLVHQWRTEERAVLVGFNTALNDNPRLTARYANGPQPLRIALDRQLTLPETHHLFDGEAQTWIINCERDERVGNVHYQRLPFDEQLLPAILQLLHAAGKVSLIVEGGARLLQSFIRQGLWDEARIFKTGTVLKAGIQAPLLSGGRLAATVPLASDRLECWTRAGHPHAVSFAGC